MPTEGLFDGPVLVTGASGFIGRSLSRRLVEAGDDVHAVVRASSTRGAGAIPGSTIHALGDASGEVAGVVDAVRPVVIFHLATLFAATHEVAGISRMVESNVTFGSVVADAATRVGARLVHTTSAWQHYGGAEYAPVSLYAATKQALCDVIRYFVEAEGLVADEVCLFDTYGPDDDRKKLVWLLIENAATGEPLPMSSGHQLVDLTHVEDVVSALVQTARGAPLGGRLVVRSGQPLTVRRLVHLIEHVTNRPIDARWGARPSRPREMTEDWSVEGVPTSWHPEIELDVGLAGVWRDRMNA